MFETWACQTAYLFAVLFAHIFRDLLIPCCLGLCKNAGVVCLQSRKLLFQLDDLSIDVNQSLDEQTEYGERFPFTSCAVITPNNRLFFFLQSRNDCDTHIVRHEIWINEEKRQNLKSRHHSIGWTDVKRHQPWAWCGHCSCRWWRWSRSQLGVHPWEGLRCCWPESKSWSPWRSYKQLWSGRPTWHDLLSR